MLCADGIEVGECESPGCPKWLGNPHGTRSWTTGWALMRYSGGALHDTRMGRLVHGAKYGHTPLNERRTMADEIAGRMMGFIAEQYEPSGLPFTDCVAPPSHQRKPFELAQYLCEEVSVGFGLINASGLLHETLPVRSMKEISDAEERLALLTRAITVDAPTTSRMPSGFLIVDDMFDTGATATAICTVLLSRFPGSEFHVLTATSRRG